MATFNIVRFSGFLGAPSRCDCRQMCPESVEWEDRHWMRYCLFLDLLWFLGDCLRVRFGTATVKEVKKGEKDPASLNLYLDPLMTLRPWPPYKDNFGVFLFFDNQPI